MDSGNPYEPPSGDCGSSGPVNEPSWRAMLLALAGSAAYVCFAIVLITSGGPDRVAGLLCLLNVPALSVWVYRLARGYGSSRVVGLVSCGIQCLIFYTMLRLEIGDTWLVYTVNSTIIVAILFFAVACRKLESRQ